MPSDNELSRRKLLALGSAAGASVLLGLDMSEADAKGTGKKGKKNGRRVPQVPRRVLGKTGQKIPILLLGGAVPLDPRFDPKIAEAMRYGVNYVDAADCYSGGSCESAVGSFHTIAKARHKLWITSKSDAHDPEGFSRTFEHSLKNLRTRFVDMYFLHMLKDPSYINAELHKVVEKLKKQGKARYFGFSCHDGNVADLLQLAAKTPWIDVVQFRYNFRRYGDATLNRAIDACAKAKVGLIAMKTQGSAASFKDRWQPFIQKGKWSKQQAVLKAVWADKRITAAVSHMDTFEKLRQNIAAALDRTKLSQAEMQELRRYAAATRSLACDGCDHLCGAALSAPVRIGDTMRYLMYHDVYGQPDEARRLFGALPRTARQLEGIDFRPASAACPNGIDLEWHMKRAARVLG